MSLGPFREVVILGAVIGVILGGVISLNSQIQSGVKSENDSALKSMTHTVRSMEADFDRATLFVHSWPNDLCEIDLKSGNMTRIRTPESPFQIANVAASQRNSVKVIVTESTESGLYRKQVRIFRNDDLIDLRDCPSEIDSLSNVCLSADGSLAALVSDGGVVVGLDLATEEFSTWNFRLPCSSFTSQMSPDGRWIFSTDGDESAAIYDFRTGEVAMNLPVSQGCSRCVAWSGDSKYLAVCNVDGGVFIFDCNLGERVWYHKLDFLFARSMAVSSSGRYVAVGGFSKHISVWNFAEQPTSPDVTIEELAVTHDLRFTENDETLISGNEDGTINEWRRDNGQLVRKLR